MLRESAKSFSTGAVFITFTLLGWASVPLFLRYLTGYIDVWTANGWRYGASALLLLPVLLVGAFNKRLPKRLWTLAIVPSLVNCCGQVCFAAAPYHIKPGLLAFLVRFQIICVTLGAYLLFPSERQILRSPSYWIGLLLVLGGSVGTFMLGHELPKPEEGVGIALGIIGSLLFGGYALAVRHYMHGLNSIISFAAISLYTAIGMVALMLIFAKDLGTVPVSIPAFPLGMLLLSSLVGIALGHIFYFASIARLGVSIAAGITLLAPFVTGAVSSFMFNERLSPGQWLAGVIAMAGAAGILATRQKLLPARGEVALARQATKDGA